jgi:hypothetical protein
MGIFSEYLSSSGKLDKPVVKDVADKVDMPSGKSKQPPKGNAQYTPKHYADGGKKLKKATKGFGDEGDSALKYDPEKTCKNVKIPTAEGIQAVKAAAAAIADNPFLAEHLIADLKRRGAMGVVVAEMFTHNDTFKHLAEVMANKDFGPTLSRKLVSALKKEEVAPPYEDFGLSEFDDEDGMGMDGMDDPDAEEDMGDDGEMGDEDATLGDDDMDFLGQMQHDGDEEPLPGDEDGMGDEMTLDGDPAAVDPNAMDDSGMALPKKPMPPAMEHLMRALNRRRG